MPNWLSTPAKICRCGGKVLPVVPPFLRGNADHSEFRGYVFAPLFYKRISDCYEEAVFCAMTKLLFRLAHDLSAVAHSVSQYLGGLNHLADQEN